MKKTFFASIISVLALVACNSTKVTSSWKAPTGKSHFNKIIVSALLPSNEKNLRPVIESELVKSLGDNGINAVSSYQAIGPTDMGANEKQVIKTLKNNGADAVLTVVLLNKDKEKNYVPGSVDYQPYGFYYGRFRGYYGYLYNRFIHQAIILLAAITFGKVICTI